MKTKKNIHKLLVLMIFLLSSIICKMAIAQSKSNQQFTNESLKLINQERTEKDTTSLISKVRFKKSNAPIVSGLSGAWYDPAYVGSGFNLIQTNSGGFLMYFYGYKGSGNGDSQWLLSEVITGPMRKNQTFTANIFSGFSGNDGNFITKPTSHGYGLMNWGEAKITINSNAGVIELKGGDGAVTYNIVPLATVDEATCANTDTGNNVSLNDVTKRADGLSGVWYDPAYRGSGFNLIQTNNGGFLMYFYGYKGSGNGDAQWLLSEVITDPVLKGQTFTIAIFSSFSGNGCEITAKPTSARNGLKDWGKAEITINNCNDGVIKLIGIDGSITHNIVPLALASSTNVAYEKPVLNKIGIAIIVGKPQIGEMLTASVIDGDGVPVTLRYQWHADGQPIANSNTENYALTANEAGKKISVEVNYIDNAGFTETLQSSPTAAVVNKIPNNRGTVSISGTPQVGEVLTASVADRDGVLAVLQYQWYDGRQPIANSNAETYALTVNEVSKTISVKVNYIDNAGFTETLQSSPTAAVVNKIPNNRGVVSISGTPQVGEVLTASVTDGDGVLAELQYQWHADGQPIANSNTETYILTTNEAGKTISVEVNYIDNAGFTETLQSSSIAAVVNNIPNNRGVVSISGTPLVGEVLTASVTDVDGVPATLQYQWHASGRPIANTETYTLTANEVGKTISVEVNYVDNAGFTETLQSSPSAAVVNKLPNNVGTVSISGTPQVGEVLTASVTDGDGVQGALQYQWRADGQMIANSTETHTLTANDAGKTISVEVNYIDNAGFTETLQSVKTQTVIGITPRMKESGLNLDMARHFYTPEAIKGFIDTIHNAGGTFLHLHFSDNENYALESSVLGQTINNSRQQSDGTYINLDTQKPFLSRAQLAEIISYAQSKGVEMIPELDMPAHSRGLLELLKLSRGQVFVDSVQVPWKDAQNNPVYQLHITQAATHTLVKEMIDEISTEFGSNSKHFHIGGDEFWGAIDHNHEYIAFVNMMADYLANKGLKTRIWNDGVLKSSLSTLNPDVEITYWSFDGQKTGAEAIENRQVRASVPDLIRAGFGVLNYNNHYLYHLPNESHFSSLSQSDHEMYTLLREWELGIWDGSDKSSMLQDSSKILGGAFSIWGEGAGDLKATSIAKFTATQLEIIIRLINAENDLSGKTKAALKFLLNNSYALMNHDVYVDLERVKQGGNLDVGGLGKQKVSLLQQDALDIRSQLEFFVQGDQRDEIMLDSSWQKNSNTMSQANQHNTVIDYQSYERGDDTLWVDKDINVITL